MYVSSIECVFLDVSCKQIMAVSYNNKTALTRNVPAENLPSCNKDESEERERERKKAE